MLYPMRMGLHMPLEIEFRPCMIVLERGPFMPDLSAVSNTLYVPLLGRIYASKHHAAILHDPAALDIDQKLDLKIKALPGQTEYSSLASAVRSQNMDYEIRAFLSANPDGVIVNVGCGLETIYQRCDNGKAIWFELDLPEVIELRRQYIPETERDRYLPSSMFDYAWMRVVRQAGDKPIMIIAAGLFIYFPKDRVISFIRHLIDFSHAELVFDTLSPTGLKIAGSMIKRMGKQAARTHFCVDDAEAFAAKISPNVKLVNTRPFYSLVDYRANLSFPTRFRMAFSDAFNMVKTIHLKLS